MLERKGLDDARLELQAAENNKGYGRRTRKGGLVSHTKNIYADMDNFQTNRIIEKKMADMLFEDSYGEYTVYCDLEFDLYQNGDYFPQTNFEECTIPYW
jgi:hypothetical protein